MFSKIKYVIGTTGAACLITAATLTISAQAASVTPNVIFGTGNGNGSFTVSTDNNVEIGLRGKIPFAGTYNYDGTKTYSFDAGLKPGSATRPNWNFEFAVNVNADDSSNPSRSIDDLTYSLSMDKDPTAGVDFSTSSFDPFNVTYADHSFGDNSTAESAGIEAADGDASGYSALLSTKNVVQQSWSYGFFLFMLSGFDPFAAGLYTINLEAFGVNGGLLASSSIDINISAVPLPAGLPLFGTGLALMGFIGWRRKRKVQMA